MADKDLETSVASSALHVGLSRSANDTIPDRKLLARLIAHGEIPFDPAMAEPLRTVIEDDVRQERKRQLIRLIARLIAHHIYATQKEILRQ